MFFDCDSDALLLRVVQEGRGACHNRCPFMFLSRVGYFSLMTAIDQDYKTLRSGIGAVTVPRDTVLATGPEAESFLQGQTSQDVALLTTGESALSFILQPHGKVDALVRITRLAEGFLIDTDRGYGERVVERLQRFKMRTKVDFEQVQWQMLAFRGGDPIALAAAAKGVAGAVTTSDAHWRLSAGFDAFGPSLEVPSDVATSSIEAYEALRIENGVPQMGFEIDEKTIPAEVGLNDQAISFRKGCYTGQELVARIDSRGNNVPRRMVGVIIEASEAPPRGALLTAPGGVGTSKPWGVLTSTAWSPGYGAAVALAFARREVQAPSEAVLDWDIGPSPCQILPLPLQP